MKHQLPPVVFYGLIAVAIFGAMGLLLTPGNPALHKGALVGQPAPEIEGETHEGKKVRLSDYKGKVVLVNFWATWCGPCREELPSLVQFQKKYAARGFEVLGMVSNDDLGKATEYAKQSGMSWPELEATPELAQTYGIKGIPASFIVNRKGEVVATIEGLVEPAVLEDEIKAQL